MFLITYNHTQFAVISVIITDRGAIELTLSVIITDGVEITDGGCTGAMEHYDTEI